MRATPVLGVYKELREGKFYRKITAQSIVINNLVLCKEGEQQRKEQTREGKNSKKF